MNRSPRVSLLLAVSAVLAACGSSPAPTPGPGAVTPAAVTLTCAATTVTVAQSVACTATARDGAGAALSPQPAVTFTSSAPGVARVAADGTVTGVAPGTASVTARAGGVTSDALGFTVSAAPVPAPSGATIVFKGSSTSAGFALLFGPASVRADGLVAYTTLERAGRVVSVFQDGTTTRVRTLTAGVPTDATVCADRAGNVVLGTVNGSVYLDRAADTLTAVPFPEVDGDPVVHSVCAPDGRVVGSATDTRTDTEHTFAWTPGQPDVTTLPTVPNSGIGLNVEDASASGDVLYHDAVLRGGRVFSFPDSSTSPVGFRGGALGGSGTVWGIASPAGGGATSLATWAEGGVTPVLTLPAAPGRSVAATTWWVVAANAGSEVLLGRQYEDSAATGGLVRTFFVYRGGALAEVRAPDGYDPQLTALDLDDRGRALVTLRDPASEFGAALALVRP